MRILHLVKTSDGASWAERQMRELVNIGYDIHAVLPGKGKLIDKYIKDKIKIHFLDLNVSIKESYKIPFLVSKLKKLIKEIKPDIIHSHFVITTLIARVALRNERIPLLFQVPGPLHLENPIISRLEIFTSRKYDFWCGSSNWIKDKYIKLGICRSRVFYSPYVPDESRFVPMNKILARTKLGFDANIKLIGMIAYFYPPRVFLGHTRGIKGHEDFIDAIYLCLKKRKDIKAVIVGGPYKKKGVRYMEKLKKYALEKCGENIIFLGERNDIPLLLACLDIAVVPSISENYGGTGEALLMEIPTIATSVGGIPEIIKPGETGFIVPPRSPKSICNQILNILENEEMAKKIASQARKYVLANYNLKNAAKQISQLYDYIIRYCNYYH